MPVYHSIIALVTFFATGVSCYCASAIYSNNADTNYLSAAHNINKKDNVITGAERLDQYVHLLKGKSVAVFANQTSLVDQLHLVDTLKSRGITIIKIFSPEHGFRGTADAG